MRAAVKALIFDVDGTLVDTEEIHRQAFNETFAGLGLDWNWHRALYGKLLQVTGGKERLLHYLARHRPDELLLTANIFDHAARVRSFELAIAATGSGKRAAA